MPLIVRDVPARLHFLTLLHTAHDEAGYLTPSAVGAIAARLRMPVAEAWEAATSYPDFRFTPPQGERAVCTGLSCLLNGAKTGPGDRAVGCQFRCYAAPASGDDVPFSEQFNRLAGPLLDVGDGSSAGLERCRAMGRDAAIHLVLDSGLCGRGGAYFPVGRKWQSALGEGRPLALVVNAEEGEPGVFKDRALLATRPRRFIEGLAIAMEVLRPELTVIFVNGQATAMRHLLEGAIQAGREMLGSRPEVVSGAGGYALGEESALLNALEGRKPVPRVRPPYPVEAGLFGMPTVVNNVESIANLSLLFQVGLKAFREHGTAEAPGTKLLSVSGQVDRPGLYEVDLGTTLRSVADLAGGDITAALCGGPSGGFLPAAEFDRPLLPGLMHPTGAVAGSGGLVFFGPAADLRAAAIALATFNAEESCGKCTPCREGTPRALEALRDGRTDGIEELLEVVGAASLCGLGQMAPGPIRSALHFWPELFR